MRSSSLVRSASIRPWALDLHGEPGDVLAAERAGELLFELRLKRDHADEGVFGAGVANFSADFVVKSG
jgi:hypothetical protein